MPTAPSALRRSTTPASDAEPRATRTSTRATVAASPVGVTPAATERSLACCLSRFTVTASTPGTGVWRRRGPASVETRDSVRGIVIWPRHGSVGTSPAYCQLFIQLMVVRWSSGSPLKVTPA